MNISWRPVRAADLPHLLGIAPDCIGDALTGREAALRVWRELLDARTLHGSVFESDAPIRGFRIVGCGIGVFVDSAFADRELASPRPGLNSRIIAAAASGDSVVLDREAIAAGNAAGGLDFVNLYGTWRYGILDANQIAEVQTLLGISFVENLAGFRFNRVIKEASGRPTIELAHATGSYRLVAEYRDNESALFVATPDDARELPFSVAATLYRYRPPSLRLRPAEQELLAAALDGKTDAELAQQLEVSVEAVKKRWMSVFARVEAFKPEILAEAGVEGRHRGPQKRHRVLAYVRTHREELRPFAWSDR